MTDTTQHQSAGSRRQELEGLIACDTELQRICRATRADEESTRRNIRSLRLQAERATVEADRLQDMLDNAMTRYREAGERIEKCRAELLTVAKRDDISKLERAVAQLAELSGADVAALHALISQGAQ